MAFRVSKPNSRPPSTATRRPQRSTSGTGTVLLSPKSSLSASRVKPAVETRPTDDLIQLSPERKMKLLRLMKSSEDRVLATTIGDQANLALWKPRMRKKGISSYLHDNVDKGLTRYCCVGRTDAPVSEIMKMFAVTTAETMLRNVRTIYGNVNEAKILTVLKSPSSANPVQSIYIRYTSFDAPRRMSSRDMCVCVSTNMTTQDDGSTVGYCLWESVDLPEFLDRFATATDKLIRSKMFRSGFVFRNSGKSNAPTNVWYLVEVEIGGIASVLTARVYLNVFGATCRRLCKHFEHRALSADAFLLPAQWTSRREARHCSHCGRHFNALSRRFNCVKCGDVVCGNCFLLEKVSVRGATVHRVRICKGCLFGAASHYVAVTARESLDSLSSNDSGVGHVLGGSVKTL